MIKLKEAALSWIEKNLQCSSSTKNLIQEQIEVDSLKMVKTNNLLKSPTHQLKKNIFTSKKSLKRNTPLFNHTESQIQIKVIKPTSLPQIIIKQSQKQYVQQYCQTGNFETESSFFNKGKVKKVQTSQQENKFQQNQPKSIASTFKTINDQFKNIKKFVKKFQQKQYTKTQQNFLKSSKSTKNQIRTKKNFFQSQKFQINQSQALKNSTNSIKIPKIQKLYCTHQAESLLLDNQGTQNNVSQVIYALNNIKKNQSNFIIQANISRGYSNKINLDIKYFQQKLSKQSL